MPDSAPAPEGLPPGGIARAYARLKQGRGWAILLLSALAVWLPLSPWLDPDFARINFALSAEASLSQAISYGGEMAVLVAILALLRLVEKLLRGVEEMMRRDLELSEATRDALEALLARRGEAALDARGGVDGIEPETP